MARNTTGTKQARKRLLLCSRSNVDPHNQRNPLPAAANTVPNKPKLRARRLRPGGTSKIHCEPIWRHSMRLCGGGSIRTSPATDCLPKLGDSLIAGRRIALSSRSVGEISLMFTEVAVGQRDACSPLAAWSAQRTLRATPCRSILPRRDLWQSGVGFAFRLFANRGVFSTSGTLTSALKDRGGLIPLSLFLLLYGQVRHLSQSGTHFPPGTPSTWISR